MFYFHKAYLTIIFSGSQPSFLQGQELRSWYGDIRNLPRDLWIVYEHVLVETDAVVTSASSAKTLSETSY